MHSSSFAAPRLLRRSLSSASPLLFRAAAQMISSSSPSSNHAHTCKAQSTSRKLIFGRTHVIQPKGEHQATIVWLHGRGDVGASWAEAMEDLMPLRNIKWIIPTAPIQALCVMDGYSCNAWFDGASRFEDAPADVEGLDASAAHVAELLSSEPPSIKLGVGGFSQGAVTSLYTTICSVIGKYSNGTVFPCKLDVCVAISGWIPKAKHIEIHLDDSTEAVHQAKHLPFFIGHGTGDNMVRFTFGEQAAASLQSMGFRDVTIKAYKGMGHHTCPTEMDDICEFFKEKLCL